MASTSSLDAEVIKAIYEADGTYAERARRFNVRPETVRRIALGLSYRDVLNPTSEDERLSCLRCIHYLGRCTMGFPEYRTRGHRTAEKCSTYWEAEAKQLAQQAS